MTREEAIKVLNTYDVNFYEYTAEEIADAIYMAIEALSAQPERKTGHWIPDNACYYETRFVCSECHNSECVSTTGFTKYGPTWKFCPNCGADMRGEKDE